MTLLIGEVSGYYRNMNVTPFAVAALTLGVILAPTAAHADDHLEPWTATVETSEPYLDCDAAMWYINVEHYTAAQLEPGVYGEAVVTTGVEEWGPATGDSADSDCPNWVIVEDTGGWYNAGTVAGEAPAEPTVTVVDDVGEKLGLDTDLKEGLA